MSKETDVKVFKKIRAIIAREDVSLEKKHLHCRFFETSSFEKLVCDL
jgi:hypothetical protein